MLAARNTSIMYMIFTASSSTHRDSKSMPKIEDIIDRPLPYAKTKFVNEPYANICPKTYGLETVSLRYYNFFGRNQDTNCTYAAVIPKFVLKLVNHNSPTINGDGSFSRDFTYIDNVIAVNIRLPIAKNPRALNTDLYSCLR